MKRYKRPTIFDLVKYTGISRGTISRAFNDQPGISTKTRAKILDAARVIGYTPHNGARMMKLGRTRRWGLMIPHFQNPYYAELVEALNHEAHIRNTTLLLGLSNHNKARETDIVSQWTAGETDGLIMDQSHYHTSPKLYEQLRARGFPILFVHGTPIPGFDFVRYDLFEAFLRALNHLFALGHERIGYIGQHFEFCRETARFHAYSQFHADRGVPIDEALVYFGEDGAPGGISAFRRWVDTNTLPTAIVCCDDVIACGVIQAARTAGLRLPKELSVTGVDDIAEATRLGLTTIRTDRRSTARSIMDLMEKRLAEPDGPTEIVSIPGELILRDSVTSRSPAGTATAGRGR